MSNYPLGAEHDPTAPYNQSNNDGLCIYCDSKEIQLIARRKAQGIADKMNQTLGDGQESYNEDDFYDACLHDEFDMRNECKQCYLDDHADDWEGDQ
jgi:hypothetical protein